MHFSSRIVRPPFEAKSRFLQVTRGCSHNRCKFCTYYRDTCFGVSSDDEIVEDLMELREEGNAFVRIWLQSADPFSLGTDRLLDVASMVHDYLPFVETIGAYARINSLKDKSTDDLAGLFDAGYDGIVFGVESADDDVLDFMCKGYDSDEIVEQLDKVDACGMSYTLIYLNGLGGRKYALTHACNTAKVFSRYHPERIMVNGLKILEDSRLYHEMLEGNFIEMDDDEKAIELSHFLENLSVDTFVDATNNTNSIRFFGRTANGRDDMVDFLRKRASSNDDC